MFNSWLFKRYIKSYVESLKHMDYLLKSDSGTFMLGNIFFIVLLFLKFTLLSDLSYLVVLFPLYGLRFFAILMNLYSVIVHGSIQSFLDGYFSLLSFVYNYKNKQIEEE